MVFDYGTLISCRAKKGGVIYIVDKQTNLIVITSSRSGLGKTLLGELIVKWAKKQLYKTMVVKHVHHSIDYRVKDTGRYLSSGADTVVAIGQEEIMKVERRKIELTKLLKGVVSRYDIIIVEGFREQLESLKTTFHKYCRIDIVEEDNKLTHRYKNGDITEIEAGRNKLLEVLRLLEQYIAEGKCKVNI